MLIAITAERSTPTITTVTGFIPRSWRCSSLVLTWPIQFWSTGRSTTVIPLSLAYARAPSVAGALVITIPARPLCMPEVIAPSSSRITPGRR